MIKNKRIILIVSAIVLVALIFLLKAKSQYKSQTSQEAGLSVGNIMVKDLLNKDSDGDGVLDWEENLYGTDPTKKDTDDDGVPDNVEAAQMKPGGEPASADGFGEAEEENLTQTDKFSRELFATVATLNQTGEVDENTVDKLTTSLTDQIKNSSPRKIFAVSEIKVITDDSPQAYIIYNNSLNSIYNKNPPRGSALDVLREFVADGENLNIDALAKLDPIIEQTTGFMNGMVSTNVPPSLAQMHVDMINALERLIENLSDIQFFDSDVIVVMGAISKFEDNTNLFQTSVEKLNDAIASKLNS